MKTKGRKPKIPDAETFLVNSKTFKSDIACSNCGSFERYVSHGECVHCKTGAKIPEETRRRAATRRSIEDLQEKLALERGWL